MISSWDASGASEPSERAEHVCGGIACKSDEVIVSIDSGNDEHLRPTQRRECRQEIEPGPASSQRSARNQDAFNRIGYHWMSESNVPVVEQGRHGHLRHKEVRVQHGQDAKEWHDHSP